MKTGVLYGIGVGPGDPELLTLKAVRTLEWVDVVYAARSTKNDYSVALEIAKPYLKDSASVEFLGFPMTRDEKDLTDAWADNAKRVTDALKDGKNAAFLTIGDPLIYSTFGYLLKTLKEQAPELNVEIIPGVTSFQAAAARTGTILTESGQNLVITSGVGEDTRFKDILPLADNTVILKTYKQFGEIRETLSRMELEENAILVSHVGQEKERVVTDIRSLNGEKPPYLSLMIVKKPQS